jgi:hypothetical protein
MASGNSINPFPLTNGVHIVHNVHKENGRAPVSQRSQPPTPTFPRTNTDQPTPKLSHTPSVRKKGVKDFEFGKTLGEGSYSTVRKNTLF